MNLVSSVRNVRYWRPFRIGYRYLFYRRSQYWPRASIEDYQDRQLRRLVRHAARHVPYYRDLFQRIGLAPERFRGRVDLARIPTLDKQTVRTRRDELIADNAATYGPQRVSTSGTTGTPLQLLISEAAQADFVASLLRCFQWAGYRFRMRTLSLQSYYHADAALEFHRVFNVMRFDSCRLGREAVLDSIERIKHWRPAFVMGFPFDLVMLTRYIADAGQTIRTIAAPRAVLCYGETLSELKRELLQTAFGCPVFDFYSHHESVAMAAECEHGHKHLLDDFACHEILPATKEDQDSGSSGELVGTGFTNYAMPLIRYRSGDHVSLVTDAPACPCGRHLSRVSAIKGKQSDFLETPDGRVLSTVMSHAIDDATGVVMSQCVQDAPDHITVKVVTDASYTPRSEQALLAGLRKRLGPDIALEVAMVDQLEKSRGGKSPFIVSRIGNEYR